MHIGLMLLSISEWDGILILPFHKFMNLLCNLISDTHDANNKNDKLSESKQKWPLREM